MTDDCPHHNVEIRWSVHHYATDETLHTAHIQAVCNACGVRFRFLGNMALAPPTAEEALSGRHGAWISGTADELGCVIAPIEPGGGLQSIAVEGRA